MNSDPFPYTPKTNPSTAIVCVDDEVEKPPTLSRSWPVGLAAEVALNQLSVGTDITDDADLCSRFKLTQTELDSIRNHPAFALEVKECAEAVQDPYATIRRKAKTAFEFYLDEVIPRLASNPKVNPETQLRAIQYLGKVAGIDAAEKAQEVAAQSEANKNNQVSAPSINIILSTPQPVAPTITVEQPLERLD